MKVNLLSVVGSLSDEIAALLAVDIPRDRSIYLGETNIIHMKSDHPLDFEKYGDCISEILASPDYVKLHDTIGSIEYVREYEENGEYVKVAVRLSQGSKLYARSLYILNKGRTENFIKTGKLIPVKKP